MLKTVARPLPGPIVPVRRQRRLRQRERAVDERQVRCRRRLRMIGLEPGEEPARRPPSRLESHARILDHGHRVLVLPAPPRQAAGEARSHVASTRREAIQIERVGGEAGRVPERTEHQPRLAPSHRQVLPDGDDRTVLGVRERCVVDVLAHVILVHSHGAVVRQREILGVDDVHRLRARADVLERDVPEPRGRQLRQDERSAEADVPPLAARDEPVVAMDRRQARRTEKRNRLDLRSVPTEMEVRRAALDLVAEEQVQDDVAVIDPPDRAVAVHLHAEPGWAPQLDRGARQPRALGARHAPGCRVVGSRGHQTCLLPHLIHRVKG
jgi:hypothetical protein